MFKSTSAAVALNESLQCPLPILKTNQGIGMRVRL